MPFKLTKAQIAERSALVHRLEEQADRVRNAVTEANEVIEQAVAAVNAEVEAYNEALSKARQFTSTVAQEAQDEIARKSERWQESRRGEAATAWASDWEDADLSDVELAEVDPVEEPEIDHAILLDELPDAVGGGEE